MGIYLIETGAILALLLITYLIVRKKYSKKDRKGFYKIVIVTLLALIAVMAVQFCLEKPKIDIQNENIRVEAKVNEELKVPETYYHFENITGEVRIEGTVDYNTVGEYEIIYIVPTMFGEYRQIQIITVEDTLPPEITLEGGEEYNQTYSKEYEEVGVKAIDIYEGDLSAKVTSTREDISETEFNMLYEVSDSAGNKATKTRHVTIVDDIPPIITLNGQEAMTILIGNAYKEEGATAQDEKDGDLSDKIVTEGNVDTNTVGEYEITYKVSDTKGNEATKIRKISVVKEEIKARMGQDGQPGVIYLTFDDGPSTSITPKILDILKQKNVKATFFILNYNSAGEALVKREVAEGHTVGIHGYSHDYNTIYKSVDAYMSNITKLQEKIKASTGYNATITRFPGGSSNTVSKYNPGIMTKLCREVVARGYKYFDWNVSSGDAGDVNTADEVYCRVTKGLSKSRSNVVLMHDFSGNTKTLNALARIIDFGISNGYTFSNITANTPMVTHKPNN